MPRMAHAMSAALSGRGWQQVSDPLSSELIHDLLTPWWRY